MPSKKPRRRPVSPLKLPLPSQFPVPSAGHELHLPHGYPTHVDSGPSPQHYVAALDHSGKCVHCKCEDRIDREPGKFPRCYSCGATQLYMGKFYDAPCVTPNGRTDGHMSYIRLGQGPPEGPRWEVCLYCGRKWDEPLPEWPEIEEEDIRVETGIGGGTGVFAGTSGLGNYCWVRITHLGHADVRAFSDVEESLLKNKAIALKSIREQLKRVGRGAYPVEEIL